jgi:hypothetical protein
MIWVWLKIIIPFWDGYFEKQIHWAHAYPKYEPTQGCSGSAQGYPPKVTINQGVSIKGAERTKIY